MKNTSIPTDVIRNAHADFSSVLLDDDDKSAEQVDMKERNRTIKITRNILYFNISDNGSCYQLTTNLYLIMYKK